MARDGACIGPCEDGGYYLLGLSRPEPALFESVDWGSERVLGQTLAQAAKTGLALAELEVQFDIDTVEDLDKLDALLATTAPDRLANTRQALSALDLKRAQPL